MFIYRYSCTYEPFQGQSQIQKTVSLGGALKKFTRLPMTENPLIKRYLLVNKSGLFAPLGLYARSFG